MQDSKTATQKETGLCAILNFTNGMADNILMKTQIDMAQAKWKSLLKDSFSSDPDTLRRYETTTFPTSQRVLGVLSPDSVEQVTECLKIANEYKIPIYTVSTGLNWAYGSGVPVSTDCCVMELSKMNRILEFNLDLAYVTIEPGVTQSQLAKFIAEKSGGALWVDTTAAAPESSVIGNLMERGHGLSPNCERAANCCNLQVVLGSGEILETGFGAFISGEKISPLEKFGLGPSLDGLFMQGNLGIVTRVTIWLVAAPEHTEIAFLSLDDDAEVAPLCDMLRPFRLRGDLKCGPQFQHIYFSLSRTMQFPWQATNGKGPLDLTTAVALGKQRGLSLWNVVIPLHGSRIQVADLRDRLQKEFTKLGLSATFRDRESIFSTSDDSESPRARDLKALFTSMTGGIGGIGLSRAYWRSRHPIPDSLQAMNPDRDGCGIYGSPVTIPFKGSEIVYVTQEACKIFFSHGLEPHISLWANTGRALQMNIFLPFNRADHGETAQAFACHQSIGQKLMALGYYPHRLSISAMGVMDRQKPANMAFLRDLKRTCDPNQILSPGRYISIEQ
jgi:4-cresol dehydrogenase (hydroxylating)